MERTSNLVSGSVGPWSIVPSVRTHNRILHEEMGACGHYSRKDGCTVFITHPPPMSEHEQWLLLNLITLISGQRSVVIANPDKPDDYLETPETSALEYSQESARADGA